MCRECSPVNLPSDQDSQTSLNLCLTYRTASLFTNTLYIKFPTRPCSVGSSRARRNDRISQDFYQHGCRIHRQVRTLCSTVSSSANHASAPSDTALLQNPILCTWLQSLLKYVDSIAHPSGNRIGEIGARGTRTETDDLTGFAPA